MDGHEFIEEIRIAQFWRKHLGDAEYVDFNPEDLRRWYVALENRGPEEIRAYLIERTGRHPMGQITGIVSAAPHPPLKIVNLWLESYDKVRTRPYWLAGLVFFIFAYYAATTLSGYMNMKTATPLQMNPPQIGLPGPGIQTPTGPVPAGSTLPTQPSAPPSSSSTSTSSGQQSGGPAH
jgi:hypothetical protein